MKYTTREDLFEENVLLSLYIRFLEIEKRMNDNFNQIENLLKREDGLCIPVR
jgi:hypothetical protein